MLELKTMHNGRPVNIFQICDTEDLYTKLSEVSLKIENLMLTKPYIWTNSVAPKVLIVWGEIQGSLHDRIFHLTKDYRGDEVLLDVYNTTWIAGHPRAITKWAGTIFKLKDVEPSRSLQHPIDDIARLIWWTNRLNLKVHVL